MGHSSKIALYAFMALSIMTATPAFAESASAPTKVYVHRTYEYQQADRNDHRYPPNLGRVGEMGISDNDRVLIGKYLQHHYKNTCAWEHDFPLTKCVAPTAAPKRHYIAGYALPSDTAFEDVPAKIAAHLNPIPVGYKYIRVGNDVVLINASTRDVIDSVTLLSTYGQ